MNSHHLVAAGYGGQGRLAGAQGDQVGVQVQAVEVGDLQRALGQEEGRFQRVGAVEGPVGGQVRMIRKRPALRSTSPAAPPRAGAGRAPEDAGQANAN